MKNTNNDISDRPTVDDLLGYKRFSIPLARKIASVSNENTPLSIGIYGQWGAGKTSFLLMVDEELQQLGVKPIWFNAWKYEKEDNLWSALIQTILGQAQVNGNFLQRARVRLNIWWDGVSLKAGLWDSAKKLVPILLRTTVFILFAYVAIASSKPQIDALITQLPLGNQVSLPSWLIKIISTIVAIFALKPDGLFKLFGTKLGIDYSTFSKKRTYKDHIAFLDEFNAELQNILSLICSGKPIVVIIDDLDRCLPEKAMQVLEAIKLFLDINGCVFLLAVDREIIEKSIAVKYKDLIASSNNKEEMFTSNKTSLAESYFEKIIHLPFTLPHLSNSDSKNLVTSLCNVPDALQSAELFSIGLPNNPRKIKRVLHLYLFLLDLSSDEIQSGRILSMLLAKLIIIQYRYQDFYNTIIEQPDILNGIEKYCINENSDFDDDDPLFLERIKNSLTLHPGLRQILLFAIDEGKTFSQANIADYLFILRTVAETEELKEEVNKYQPDNQNKLLAKILRQTQEQASSIRSFGSTKTVSLKDVYTPLRFGPYDKSSNVKEREIFSLQDVLKKSSRLVIIGGPGTGKTTLLKYISSILSDSYFQMESGQQDVLKFKRRLFPVFLSAREFHHQNNDIKSNIFPAQFLELMRKYFEGNNYSVPSDLFENLMDKGKCMLMIDGIDELPDPTERYRLIESMNVLSERYPNNRYILTSRPLDSYGMVMSKSTYQFFEILTLDSKQLKEIITKRLNPIDKNNNLSLFMEIVDNDTRLMDIAKSPLLLEVMLRVFENSGMIPYKISALYSEIIELMVFKWDTSRGITQSDMIVSKKEIVHILGKIALYFFKNEITLFTEEELINLLSHMNNLNNTESNQIVDFIKERSGILVEVEQNKFHFIHRSIQEYLAATEISRSDDYSVYLDKYKDEQWKHILIHLMEIIPDANSLVKELITKNDEDSIIMLSEILKSKISIKPQIKERAKNIVAKWEE